jgi:hypothetical protein
MEHSNLRLNSSIQVSPRIGVAYLRRFDVVCLPAFFVKRRPEQATDTGNAIVIPRSSDTSAAPGYELIVDVRHVGRSFAERRLYSEPHSHNKAGYDDRDDSLEGIAMCLLDASTAGPQVLKIRAKLVS